MCYHVSTPVSMKLKLELQRLELDLSVPDYESYFHLNGFEHQSLPVWTSLYPKKIILGQWGFLPAWAQNKDLAAKTLNAVSETAFEKPIFREAMRQSRCLIWVDGFFEWQHLGKSKQAYFISMPEARPFALGGLYSEWLDPATQSTIPTVSILTTQANTLMAEIHNIKKRMPLILEQANWPVWQDSKASEALIKGIMNPLEDGKLHAHPIANIISGKNSNRAEVQQEERKNLLF